MTGEKEIPQNKERTWDKAALDVVHNVVAAGAEGKRGSALLFAGLDAALNTKHFQQQSKRYDNASADNQRNTQRHNLAMKMGEIDLQRKQLQLDNAYRANEMITINSNIKNRLATNPAYDWNMFSNEEQTAILNSPAVQNVARGHYYFREALKSRKDPEAWGRFQRQIQDAGGRITDDGKKNFTMEILGRSIPLNEQSGMQINKNLEDALFKEVEARKAISYNATRGSAIGKILASRVKEIIPYTKGSASEATQIMKKSISGLTQNQRDVMFARKTLSDIFDPYVGDDEKTAEAEMALAKNQAGMSILERMGFRFNPGKEGIADATVVPIDNPNAPPMTLPQFSMYLERNDTGSQILDKQRDAMKGIFEARAKENLLKEMRRTGRDLTGAGEGEKPVSTEDDSTGERQYGDSWVELEDSQKNKLINAQNTILKTAVDRGVVIKKNGEYTLNPKSSKNDVRKLVVLENSLFDKRGLKDFKNKGTMATLSEIEKDKNKISSNKEKIEQISRAKDMAMQPTSKNKTSFWGELSKNLARAYAAEAYPNLHIASEFIEAGNKAKTKRMERNKKRIEKPLKKEK